ncbi:hypothetical protein NQ315_002978 [Exocentrus adspersus]|uniref:Carboxylic ester hydrolase n=1 Tax=Exocentrus adspersus TaxID=1586481 RepID=A0AAV8W4J9_9CUCU|nr:hypothetical protein NQ315_002978 [Exocentrus adspersus]
MLRTVSVVLAFLLNIANCEVLVKLPNGQIRGRTESTYTNVTFYAFQEIPFAKPPVGKLRFMAPQSNDNWEGILDCTKQTKICPQINHNDEQENEDCLYLNVYTPVEPSSNSNLSVIYYIYGGSFNHGSNKFDRFGPHFLIEQGVVVVIPNYRLGPMGFLSIQDEVIPGNNGLKDQNLGLKWVQENIQLFGGDPSKVTIIGQSAGAASVTLQILSKQSRGLFRAAVAQSGSALTPWSYQRHARDVAYEFAAEFDSNFTTKNTSEELLKLLQTIPEKDMATVFASFKPRVPGEGFTWAPVIEPAHESAFLTKNQHELLESGDINQVPLVIGICSEEDINKASDLESLKKQGSSYDKDVKQLVTEDLHLTDDDVKAQAGEQIRKVYSDGQFASNLSSVVKFQSDNSFTRGTIRFAELQSRLTDVYFYQFSYFGELTFAKEIYLPGAGKVPHAGDNYFLWTKMNRSNIHAYPDADALTSQRYVKLFADFSKYLNPTPEESDLMDNIVWPKVNATHFWYLDIDENLEVKLNPKGEAYRGWVDVYDSWGVKPFDTY